MLSIGKILVPVDFSENCRGALRYADSLSKRFDSSIVAVFVAEPLEGMTGMEPPASMNKAIVERRDRLANQLDSWAGASAPDSTERVVLEGDPATQIVKYARDHHVGLIVMPTHGYGPIRQFLLGSVTAKVLHDATCPVWTGVHMERAAISDPFQIRKVACAVDLNLQTRAVLCWAAGLASAWDAELDIMNVLSAMPDSAWTETMERIAREELADHQAAIGRPSHLHFGSGKVAPTVAALTGTLQADVLVVGRSHGSSGGHLPGNTYAIVRQSPCPVVSV